MEKVTILLLISLLASVRELQLQCRLSSHETSLLTNLLATGKKVRSQRLHSGLNGRTADYSAHAV